MDIERIKKINPQTAEYKGYKIKRSGDIYNKSGHNVAIDRAGKKKKYVRIAQDGKQEYIKLVDLVFYSFSNKKCKRGKKPAYKNMDDTSYENIIIVPTNSSKRKLDAKTVRAIRKDYGLGEVHRGDLRNQHNRIYPSMRQLAKKYNVSLSTIQKIMKGDYFEV